MARSPEDLAILLDVISGPDPAVPLPLACDPVAPLRAADLRGRRIGWLGDWGGAMTTEAGILDLSRSAVQVMADLGAEVEAVAPPFPADAMWEAWITLRSWAVAASLSAHQDRRDMLKDSALWELDRGLALSAMDVHNASLVRSDWFRTAATLLTRFDALVLPSAQVWPFDVTLPWPTEIAGRQMDTYHRWMQVVVPVSLIGLPSLAMPAGFGAGGLPMGIQLFGRHGSDADLLAMGAAYHDATGWPQKRPAL
jgi:amidase